MVSYLFAVVLALTISQPFHSQTTPAPVQTSPNPRRPLCGPLYEHQDHRHLPVGTRIFRTFAGAVYYQYPGRPLPAEFRNVRPVVVIIK